MSWAGVLRVGEVGVGIESRFSRSGWAGIGLMNRKLHTSRPKQSRVHDDFIAPSFPVLFKTCLDLDVHFYAIFLKKMTECTAKSELAMSVE